MTVTCGCVLSSQLSWPADCGCQNCILWTNFYFLHNLAPPCGARGRGEVVWGWSCPCHNQIDRWCHWFVRVWTHRVQGAGCSCCHMQAGKHKPWKSPSKLGLCLYKFHHNTTGLFQNSWQSIVSFSDWSHHLIRLMDSHYVWWMAASAWHHIIGM